MAPFAAAVAAMIAMGGLLLVVAGLTPTAVPEQPREPAAQVGRVLGADPRTRRMRLLALIGVVVGVVITLLTGWFVALILVPAAFVGVPMLVMTTHNKQQIARIEAMEEWTRSLAGVLGAGVGLEQAIQATLSPSTPEAIRPEIQLLVARLRARWDTERALRAFADDLSDPTSDAIVAGLLLASERRGQGLATMLDEIAARAAEDVRNRRRMEADYAKPRSTARWVTIITIGVLVAMTFNGDYIEPYSTPLGQVVLVLLLSLYVMSLLWMRRMATGEDLQRFLGDDAAQRGNHS